MSKGEMKIRVAGGEKSLDFRRLKISRKEMVGTDTAGSGSTKAAVSGYHCSWAALLRFLCLSCPLALRV